MTTIEITILPPTHLTANELNRIKDELEEVCRRKLEMYNMTGIVEARFRY